MMSLIANGVLFVLLGMVALVIFLWLCWAAIELFGMIREMLEDLCR